MSIAVTAVIKPSRLLRLALAGYAAASVAAAVLVAAVQPARFHAPAALAAACAAVALVASRAAVQAPNARRIDISGPGEIRLSVQQSLGVAAAQNAPMQLLPGSTVWPSLLILLLRNTENGAVTVVAILPDSVNAGQFRKIAVSIRAIAGRDNKFSGKNKIL